MSQKFSVQPPISARQRFLTIGGQEMKEWISLGRIAEIGPTREVRIDVGLEHVLAIVGKRGAGKSFTLGAVIEGLVTRARETGLNQISKTRGVLLFDTLNIFQWMSAPVSEEAASAHVRSQARLLRDWKLAPVELDVDLWAPAGFAPVANARALQIAGYDMGVDDWAALLTIDATRDIMGQLLTQLIDKVARRGWSSGDGIEARAKPNYTIADLVRCLGSDAEIARDYARETIRALRQRLTAYEASPLFGETGTTLTELVRPGRLSVVLLSGVPDDLRLVLVFLIMRKLLFLRARASEAAKTLQLRRVSDEERHAIAQTVQEAPPKTWVFVDEAQNVFPSTHQTSASEILLRYVREGRNFGLSLGFTTQQPSAIDPRVMAQVDVLLAHQLTVQRDLQHVLSNLKGSAPDAVRLRGRQLELDDAIRQLDVGQVFATATEGPRALFIDVRPRASVHGGFEG